MELLTNQLTLLGAPIFITVKVSDLFNSNYPPENENAINNFTELTSASGSANYGDPKSNFQTPVSKNDTVIWIIQFESNSERKDYDLDLVCITQKNIPDNPNYFNFHPLLPTNNIIMAKAANVDQAHPYEYYIIFTISDKNGTVKTYAIDPKLLAK